MQAKLRQVYRLNLNDGWSMEAIMIPKMKLQLQSQIILGALQDLNGECADQDTYEVSAQILFGADQAILFPHAVKDWTGSLMQINQARLMQSEITGKYIIFRACSRHYSHSRRRNPWVRSNQVQQDKSDSSSEDVLISIMDLIHLNEAGIMELGSSSD